MKWARVLARVAILSLAACVFIGLTELYAGSLLPPFQNPRAQALRWHRPSEPQLGRLPSFILEGMLLALINGAGRIVFRLRLSPASRRED